MIIDVNNKSFNYDNLLRIARTIDPVNYMDIVHDHILTGKSMKGLKYNYFTVVECDTLKHSGTCNTCSKCNTIKPMSEFLLKETRGKKYIMNTCNVCRIKRIVEVKAKKYKSDPTYRDAQKKYSKNYYDRNKTEILKKLQEHRQKPEIKEARRAYMRDYNKKVSEIKKLNNKNENHST